MKAHECNLPGHSTSSKAYRIYSKSTLIVEQPMYEVFDESRILLKNIESFYKNKYLTKRKGRDKH